MAIDIGRIAYQEYCQVVLTRTIPQPHLDKWEDLGKVKQDAWRHAAVAVLRYIEQEEAKLEDSID